MYYWLKLRTVMKDKIGFLCKRRFCYLLLAGIFLFCSRPVLATTFQEAINSAVNGVVDLTPGEEYTGGAYFPSDVVVNGNGARIVVGDGDYYSSTESNVRVELNNLTIDGGTNGIYLKHGSSLLADQLTIKNVTNSGISSDGAALIKITGSIFQDIGGYGINLYNASQVKLISDCFFSGIGSIPILINHSSSVDSIIDCEIVGAGDTSGDAISIQGSSSAVIENCDISMGTAGVAVVSNSTVTVTDCRIHGNLKVNDTREKGQGVYVLEGSNAKIIGTRIENNDNAGLYCDDSDIEVGRSVFDHNGWGALDGEGIDCRNDSTAVIYDSKITANYLYGIQRTDSSITVEGCEVRNNRLGGINIGHLTVAKTPNAVIRGCMLDSNYTDSSPATTYEIVLSGSNTNADIGQCYFGFNPNIGMLLQSESYANIESSVFMSNSGNNVNVYNANFDANWSSFSDSNYSIYFNTANSSSVHNSDFFNNFVKHAQSQDSSPYPSCSNNWWGDGEDPGSSVIKVDVDPWLSEQVAFTCLERGYDLSAGGNKQFSFIDLPIEIGVCGGSDTLTDQIFIAYASHHNIFPDLPEPAIGFTPTPNNIVYMWIDASLETRFSTENETIEFFHGSDMFENPASGEVLKFNDDSQQWQALDKTFFEAEGRVLADVSDVAGRYILCTNHNVCPTADFTANPTEGDSPLMVEFTDSSTGNPTVWSWVFGDGHTSNEQNPLHIFENSGSYDVELTVSNYAGDDTYGTTVNVGDCNKENVWLNSVGFQEISSAYDYANDDDILQLHAVTFIETLTFDKDISVALQGGYDCGYENRIRNSTIKGCLTVEAGCLELSNIEIN